MRQSTPSGDHCNDGPGRVCSCSRGAKTSRPRPGRSKPSGIMGAATAAVRKARNAMTGVRTVVTAALVLALLTGAAPAAFAQLQPPEVRGLRGAKFPSMNPPPDVRSFGEGPQWDGRPPDGIQPLPVDMFTSKDFYKDRALWMDVRYWRCNAPRQIADMRSGGAGSSTNDPRIGSNPPGSDRKSA